MLIVYSVYPQIMQNLVQKLMQHLFAVTSTKVTVMLKSLLMNGLTLFITPVTAMFCKKAVSYPKGQQHAFLLRHAVPSDSNIYHIFNQDIPLIDLLFALYDDLYKVQALLCLLLWHLQRVKMYYIQDTPICE